MTKSDELRTFFERIRKCRKCHGQDGILVPVPDPLPDPAKARVLLLGEQPERDTAGKKGPVGLASDKSLERLRRYVEASGLDHDTIFYVPAVLCVPREASARPDRPAIREVRACSGHLQNLLNLTRPTVVVPLGHTAVQALQTAWSDWTELRQFILNYDVGSYIERNGTAVYPLYFPTEATLRTRVEARQRRDWQRLAQVLESVEKKAAAR